MEEEAGEQPEDLVGKACGCALTCSQTSLTTQSIKSEYQRQTYRLL